MQISVPSVDRIPPRSRPVLSGSCHETCTPPRRNAHFISICRSDPTRILSNPVRIPPRDMHPASAKRTFYFHPSIGSHRDPIQSRRGLATKRAPCPGETHILLPSVDRIPPGSCPIPSGSCHETCTLPRRNAHFTSIHRSDPTRIPSNPVRILPRNVHPAPAKRTFYFHPSIGSHQDPIQSRQDPATKRAPRLGETLILVPSVDRIPPGSRPIPSGSCHETCTLPWRNANFISIRRSDPTRIPSNPVRILPRNVHPASAKRTFHRRASKTIPSDPAYDPVGFVGKPKGKLILQASA